MCKLSYGGKPIQFQNLCFVCIKRVFFFVFAGITKPQRPHDGEHCVYSYVVCIWNLKVFFNHHTGAKLAITVLYNQKDSLIAQLVLPKF